MIGPDGYDPRWDDDRDLYRDREGRPCTLRRYVEIASDESLRRIGYSYVRGASGPTYVSTIWLGVGLELFGPPLIFETMVFDRDGNPLYDYSRRWPTLEVAQKGHLMIADRIAQGWWVNLGGLA